MLDRSTDMTASGSARSLSPVRASMTTISEAAEFLRDLMWRTSLLRFVARGLAVGWAEAVGVSLGRGVATCAAQATRRKASANMTTRLGRISIASLIQTGPAGGSRPLAQRIRQDDKLGDAPVERLEAIRDAVLGPVHDGEALHRGDAHRAADRDDRAQRCGGRLVREPIRERGERDVGDADRQRERGERRSRREQR